jgi:hypothetical protein
MTFSIKLAGEPESIRDEFCERIEMARKLAATSDEQKAVAAVSFSIHRNIDFCRIQHIPQIIIEASGVTDYKGAGFAARIVVKISVEYVFGFVADEDTQNVQAALAVERRIQ